MFIEYQIHDIIIYNISQKDIDIMFYHLQILLIMRIRIRTILFNA